MNRSLLKARARASMLWARPGVLMVCLTYWSVRWVVDWLTALEIPVKDGLIDPAALLNDSRALIMMALGLVVAAAMQALIAGHDYLYPLALSRDEEAGFRSLLEPARRPWRFTILPLLLKGLIALPMAPAAALAVASTFKHWAGIQALTSQIMTGWAAGAEMDALERASVKLMDLALPTPVWLAAGGGLALSLFIWLTYAQAVFVAIDEPELSPLECMGKSRRLMRGRRLELLLITVSFIPWFVPLFISAGLIFSASFLALMGLGITLLLAVWATLYRNVTRANYYSLITGQLKKVQHPGGFSPEAIALLTGHLPQPVPSEDEDDDTDGDDDDADKPDDEEARQRLIDKMWKP